MTDVKFQNEIAFHKDVAEKSKSLLAPQSEIIITRYKQSKNWKIFEKELIFKSINDYAAKSDKPILIADFGCGDGSNSCQIAKIIDNAEVAGFDLSPDLIEVAKERAIIDGVDKRTDFFVANAEDQNPLQDREVDVMLCLNILHHVDLSAVIPNLLKATKSNGMIIIQEPIAFSKNLQTLRDNLPVEKNITPDERQLSKKEIDYLLSLVDASTIYYNYLFSRLTRFLKNRSKIDSGHPFTKACVHFLMRFDNALVAALPFLKKYCGRVVIIGHKSSTL